MKTYSMDLRERVVAACDEGVLTREEIAERFSVSVSWIRSLIKRRREVGTIEPKPRGGGRVRAFDANADARLREAVRNNPDATLEELARAAEVVCAPSVVFRALKRLDLPRKKSRGGLRSRIVRS